jgi:tRNA synthetases class I (E and Q), catalytic domain
MQVTHVLRAEEHLPNTLRQLLIYEALGYTPPKFGHMSLILAPDKSKLSKRHGATSVGEFRQQVRRLVLSFHDACKYQRAYQTTPARFSMHFRATSGQCGHVYVLQHCGKCVRVWN